MFEGVGVLVESERKKGRKEVSEGRRWDDGLEGRSAQRTVEVPTGSKVYHKT